jgi:hypothetical protein
MTLDASKQNDDARLNGTVRSAVGGSSVRAADV